MIWRNLSWQVVTKGVKVGNTSAGEVEAGH